MGVLTQQDYENELKNSRGGKRAIIDPPCPSGEDFDKKNEEPITAYFLLHPENPKDAYLNFEDELVLDGKSFKRKCVNGVVRTTHKVLCDFLISKQYELLSKKEISDEQKRAEGID